MALLAEYASGDITEIVRQSLECLNSAGKSGAVVYPKLLELIDR